MYSCLFRLLLLNLYVNDSFIQLGVRILNFKFRALSEIFSKFLKLIKTLSLSSRENSYSVRPAVPFSVFNSRMIYTSCLSTTRLRRACEDKKDFLVCEMMNNSLFYISHCAHFKNSRIVRRRRCVDIAPPSQSPTEVPRVLHVDNCTTGNS